MIFSGKINFIFPDNTRKIIFQREFFWKDHLFRTFGKRKYGFSCSDSLRGQEIQIRHRRLELRPLSLAAQYSGN